MPKFDITINGQDYEVDALNEKALPEIAETILKKETNAPEKLPERPEGLISKTAESLKKASKAMPEILQFAGGIAGATTFPARPFTSSAIGGTIGRTAGSEFERQAQIQPFRTFARTALIPTGLGGIAGSPPPMSKEEAEKGIKGFKRTATIEGITAPLAFGGSKTLKFLGSGAMKAFQGPRVVERAAERGWRTLLNPEFYKGRVPKTIAVGMDKFFTKLSNTTGQSIDDVLKTPKYANTRVIVKGLKEKTKNILPKGVKINDFDISMAQKKLLKRETDKILQMGGKGRKLDTLWQQRRKLDDLIFSKNWGDEAHDYLTQLRNILNRPITSAGTEIKEAFNKYAFVKSAEKELGKSFKAIIRKDTGETFSSKLEKFLGNSLSTSKDETLRILKELDSLLGADDKIINNALDFAASEIIEKGPSIGLGAVQRFISGMIGGRKALAQLGAVAGAKTTKTLFRGVGRAIPTVITEGVNK